MNNDFIKKSSESTEETEQLDLKFDIKVLLYDISRSAIFFVALGIILAVIFFIIFRLKSTSSMERWSARARLFHQSRSEKLPSFYKQINTPTIAALINSKTVLVQVASYLNMPKERNLHPNSLSGLVNIYVDKKNFPDNIMIEGKYNNPDMVAKIVNAVAEIGIKEYSKFQNQSGYEILSERRHHREFLENKLKELEKSRSSLFIADTMLSPLDEQNRLRLLISNLLEKIENNKLEIMMLQEKIKISSEKLKTIDKEMKYHEKVIDGQDAGLIQAENELIRLRQIYTDENPRVKKAMNDFELQKKILEGRRKQTGGGVSSKNEIVYAANPIYYNLQEVMLTDDTRLQGLIKSNADNLKSIETYKIKLANLIDSINLYNEMLNESQTIKDNIKNVDETINNMSMLVNSGAQDLSIAEYASIPLRPKISGATQMISAVVISIFIAGFAWILFLVINFFVGKIKSSREFSLLGKIDDIGEIPLESNEKVNIAFDYTFENLCKNAPDLKRLFMVAPRLIDSIGDLNEKWQENAGLQGKKTFFLTISDRDPQISAADSKNIRSESIDDELITVIKSGNTGTFVAGNILNITQTERELLNADLQTINSVYDIIIIRLNQGVSVKENIISQLMSIADYTLFLIEFNRQNKLFLYDVKRKIDKNNFKCGGVLFNVQRKFWRFEF